MALGALGVGLVRWLYLAVTGRRLDLGGWPASALTMSAVVGVTALASLAALALAQPTYVRDQYWSDFAPVMQLFVVFGGFTAAALLTRRPRGKGDGDSSLEHDSVPTPRTAALVGSSTQTGT